MFILNLGANIFYKPHSYHPTSSPHPDELGESVTLLAFLTVRHGDKFGVTDSSSK